MGNLFKFLFRYTKGLRGLIVLVVILTVLQVSCEIFAAFSLKFIPSKVQNVGHDPACLFRFLDPIECWCDTPQRDPGLQPGPNMAPNPPPEPRAPVNRNAASAENDV